MALDVKEFKSHLNPESMLYILSEKTLQNLMSGFCNELDAGVALLYNLNDPGSREIRRVDAFGSIEVVSEKFFNPICKEYRLIDKQDEKCKECDKEIALKYFNGEFTECRLYDCHLGLKDMTYPLKLGKDTRGVITGGQIIPNNPEAIENIKKRITENTVSDEESDKLIEILEFNEKLSEAEIKERYRNFQHFGYMVQELLSTIYNFQKDASEKKLLNELGEYLTTADTTNPERWWMATSELISDFCQITGISKIAVFGRKESRYILEATNEGVPSESEKNKIPVRQVISTIPYGSLTKIDDIDINKIMNGITKETDLAKKLTGPALPIWLYHSDFPQRPDIALSTLIVIYDDIPDNLHILCQEFCSILGLRVAITLLVFRIEFERKNIQENVIRTTHAAKTPLQAIVFALEEIIFRTKDNSAFSDMKAELESSLNNIVWVRDSLTRLLHGPVLSERKEKEILEFCREIALDMEPIASTPEKRCWISVIPKIPKCIVRMAEFDMRRALAALIDNAIKFSWKEHEIQIYIDLFGTDWVEITIRNYGIGIPKEKLDLVLEEGFRALIPDRKVDRPGTGGGLPTANQIINAHGGWMEIESYPADKNYREVKHHRYITSVKIVLPTVIKRGDKNVEEENTSN